MDITQHLCNQLVSSLKKHTLNPPTEACRMPLRCVREKLEKKHGQPLGFSDEQLAIALEALGYKVNRKIWKTNARVVLSRVRK